MSDLLTVPHYKAKPKWLKVSFPGGERYNWIKGRVGEVKLSTVCQEAHCPNIGECWNSGTATFMLMGDTCTRGCRFCAVNTARQPGSLDAEEPKKLADTLSEMKLSYLVLTTVNRDDLPDQGATHIARCIRAVKRSNPHILVEILMPDFQGDTSLVQKIIDAQPAVLGHNVETVERLTPHVRDPRASYHQSLDVLRFMKNKVPQGYTKSSLMLGLGETHEEIIRTMADLRKIKVDFLTLGQYLQPSRKNLKVERFVTPKEFNDYAEIGKELGFLYVASGPLVRSSYRAAEFYIERTICKN